MVHQRIHIGEDAQRATVAIEDVSRTPGPLDRVAELSARRLAAVFDMDDVAVTEMVSDGFG